MPVSESETIVRLAARGDGVTESGRFVPMTAPGDSVAADGAVTPGPHHQTPPCRHFPECGGCQLQHVDDAAYAAFLNDRIASALAAQGVAAPEIREPHLSPPRSRRRAALKAAGGLDRLQRRRRATASSTCANATSCGPNCSRWSRRSAGCSRGRAGVVMTLADQGVDLLLEGVAVEGLEASEAMTAFAREHGLARLAARRRLRRADPLGARAGHHHPGRRPGRAARRRLPAGDGGRRGGSGRRGARGGRRRRRHRRPVRRPRHLRAGAFGQGLRGRGRARRRAGAEGRRAEASSSTIATSTAARST